jgi:hypothetical protein
VSWHVVRARQEVVEFLDIEQVFKNRCESTLQLTMRVHTERFQCQRENNFSNSILFEESLHNNEEGKDLSLRLSSMFHMWSLRVKQTHPYRDKDVYNKSVITRVRNIVYELPRGGKKTR